MILYINTSSPDKIVIALRKDSLLVAQKRIMAPRRQAEKLLLVIDQLLKKNKVKPKTLKKIIVANRGGSFTSLRIGIITANALAYGLNIPVEAEIKKGIKNKKFASYSIVEPIYDREPTIGIAKNKNLSPVH